jgi:alkylation response protein AidB-like acyl-CoA dehydrogenase
VSQSQNRYRCDLRDYRFLLFEQFRLQEILGKGPMKDWGEEEVTMVLDEVYKWSCDVLGPLNESADREGCHFESGRVTTPSGFKEAWKSLYEAGWRGLGVAEEHGGQGGPWTLAACAGELMSGANTAFNMYPGLAHGVAEVIEKFGTPEQVETFVKKLYTGEWCGTMCLTEPHAGSDVGSATTKAIATGDEGVYKIEGTKIFISGGDHDLTPNIIHLVLARTPEAPSGTKGLSLFLVPSQKLDGSGSNNVACASIEKKMGIKASSTCVLNFGENGDCLGYLVGTEEQRGMRQMFQMMNMARIMVGMQGLAVASTAYLNALEYAQERKQGPNVKEWKNDDAARVAIIQHPDVRRMLLDMKARVEGIRALIVKLAVHQDRHILATDEEEKAKHKGQIDLLVPLVKAYASDQGFQVAATAIQVFGGAGYLKDHPVEQYCRDAKIFSIYEGTNHIQALDLVGRKLGQKGGANFQAFLQEVGEFVSRHASSDRYGAAVAKLGEATQALGACAMRFLGWFQGGKMTHVPLVANRFLEMMSVTAISWLLLEQATIAESKLAELDEDHPDYNFYLGKRYVALYFANLELPGVVTGAEYIGAEDQSPMEIPDEAFSTLEF